MFSSEARKNQQNNKFLILIDDEDQIKNPFTTEIYKNHFQRIFHDDDNFDYQSDLSVVEKLIVKKDIGKTEETSLSNKEEVNSEVKSNILVVPPLKKVQKPKKLKIKKDLDDRFTNGRWKLEEHQRFIKAIILYGNEWKKVEEYVGTRSSTQARSHAQKFFEKMKMANLVDINFDFEKKSSIKSLHLTLKEMEKGNKEMLKELNNLAFERKNSKKKKISSFSEEDLKTMDNSSEKNNLISDDLKKKRKIGFTIHKTNDNDEDNKTTTITKSKNIFGIKNEDSNNKNKTPPINNDILNSYNKLGLVNFPNSTNLKRKRQRKLSTGSMELSWLDNDNADKEDIQKLMLHLFDKNMEQNLTEMNDSEYEETLFFKKRDKEFCEHIELGGEDVIQKFLSD